MNSYAKHLVALGLSALFTFYSGAAPASAQDQTITSAPSLSAQSPTTTQSTTLSHWTAVPVGLQVQIAHPIFDQGGYQLVDSAGNTIVVPFDNDNLYVLKFAVSSNGSTYFINTGTAPVLYLPSNGYVDNASVNGTHWYPFTSDFQPTTPVYEGIAPSWHDFILMGWYAGMSFYGGYSSSTSFTDGGTFAPASDLYAEINGQSYLGWPNYHDYIAATGGYNYVTYYNEGIYTRAGQGLPIPATAPPVTDASAAPTVPTPPTVVPQPVPVAATPSVPETAPAHVFRGAIGYGFYGQDGEPPEPANMHIFRGAANYYYSGN